MEAVRQLVSCASCSRMREAAGRGGHDPIPSQQRSTRARARGASLSWLRTPLALLLALHARSAGSVPVGSLSQSASGGAQSGRPSAPDVDVGDWVGKPVDLGFEPTVLQTTLMASGALHDGGGTFPAALSRYFPRYTLCEQCSAEGLEKALKRDECYVCPVIFCVPCWHLKENANVVMTPPYGYCAQTMDNPHYPKTCSNSQSKPLAGAFRCVDKNGNKKNSADCNPLYAMIGNSWDTGGIDMPNLKLVLQSVAQLFNPSLRPALEPDYFDVRAAYKGAVLEPYPFLTPGATPNNLAPPL